MNTSWLSEYTSWMMYIVLDRQKLRIRGWFLWKAHMIIYTLLIRNVETWQYLANEGAVAYRVALSNYVCNCHINFVYLSLSLNTCHGPPHSDIYFIDQWLFLKSFRRQAYIQNNGDGKVIFKNNLEYNVNWFRYKCMLKPIAVIMRKVVFVADVCDNIFGKLFKDQRKCYMLWLKPLYT